MISSSKRLVTVAMALLPPLLLTLEGCVSQGPLRNLSGERARQVTFEGNAPPCSSPQLCDRLPVELHKDYTLFFTEFDDDGWLVSANSDAVAFGYEHRSGERGKNEKDTIGNIKSTLRNLPDPSLIVLFIHGWKHNASTGDSNVIDFRNEIEDLAALYPDRNIVGIYVGWRGTPILGVDLLKDITFYNRKRAAENVAKGSVQELIAFIAAYERSRNVSHVDPTRDERGTDIRPLRVKRWSNDAPNRASLQPVISIFVGHSFGGLILFESLSQPLLTYVIDDELRARDRQKEEATAAALPDLAVLLNPAVEAVRFEPLYRAMRGRRSLTYRGPRLVAITTTADLATRLAFPATRVFSASTTSVERYQAYVNTIGHAERYITHTLKYPAKNPCTDRISGDSSQCIGGSRLEASDGVEFRCANFREMWNIRTDETLMSGHNDIAGKKIFNFINDLVARKFATDLKPDPICCPPQTPSALKGLGCSKKPDLSFGE